MSPIFWRYMIATTLGNLVWETLQFPFYTLWTEGSLNEILIALLHCTLGDILIAAACFGIAIFILGRDSVLRNAWRLAPIAIPLGVGYTIFSEWLNVSVRGNWEYAPNMPVLPGLGTGLFPLMQWFLVPAIGFWFLSYGRTKT